MKSQIIFNLDGRLAEGKSDLDGETATLLTRLAGIVDVASISGGAWGQFEKRSCWRYCGAEPRRADPSQRHLL
jgi:hypothetical protein